MKRTCLKMYVFTFSYDSGNTLPQSSTFYWRIDENGWKNSVCSNVYLEKHAPPQWKKTDSESDFLLFISNMLPFLGHSLFI